MTNIAEGKQWPSLKMRNTELPSMLNMDINLSVFARGHHVTHESFYITIQCCLLASAIALCLCTYNILFKIQDGYSRHLASYDGHFDIVGKGVHDFLIALNVTSDDILHSLLTNRRNVVKIPIFTLPPPIHPKF